MLLLLEAFDEVGNALGDPWVLYPLAHVEFGGGLVGGLGWGKEGEESGGWEEEEEREEEEDASWWLLS